MIDTPTPETGGDAQAAPDAIEAIFKVAEIPAGEKPQEAPKEGEENTAKEEDTPFPKKAVNALSRRDKQIGRLRAEKDQMAAELNKFREAAAPKLTPANDGRPKEADFNNYADYMEAVQDWKIDQKLTTQKTENKATQDAATNQQWVHDRSQAVDKQAEEFAKEYPDIGELFNSNEALVKSFPREIRMALLEADNAPLAFYNLAKEDKLADLADMSLVDAKVEIRLAQKMQPAKPKTNAPKPLPASRGSVPASKPLEKLTAREAHQLLSSKD